MDTIDVVIVLCGQYTHLASGVATELTIARDKGKPYFLLAAYSGTRTVSSQAARRRLTRCTAGHGTTSRR